MAETGLVVDVRGSGPAAGDGADGDFAARNDEGLRVVALRSDIDALPMTECSPHLPHRSRRPGAAHMCGHDGHMATLLGATTLLLAHRDRIPSDSVVRLLWQPAEEGGPRGGGAKPMVEQGCLEGVSEVYGFHNWPKFPLGTIRVASGPVMARVTDLDIVVRGKGCHASQPSAGGGADAVLAAAHVVVGLQQVVSRSVHFLDSAVVSVATVHGGEARNVLPDEVKLSGTIRTLRDEVTETVMRRVAEVAKGAALAGGCEAEVSFTDLYPALVNAKGPAEAARKAAAEVLGEGSVVDLTGADAASVSSDGLPVLGGEDFAFYTKEIPGCYWFVGTEEEGRENPMLHATTFDFNDRALPVGVAMYLRLVDARLGASVCEAAKVPEIVRPADFLPPAIAKVGAGAAVEGKEVS